MNSKEGSALVHKCFILFTESPADMLDCATSEIATGSRLAVDATKKLPGEGFKRPSPPLIKMDAVRLPLLRRTPTRFSRA